MIRMPLMMLLDAVTGLPAVRFQVRGFYEMLSVPAGGALIDRKMSCGSRGGGRTLLFHIQKQLGFANLGALRVGVQAVCEQLGEVGRSLLAVSSKLRRVCCTIKRIETLRRGPQRCLEGFECLSGLVQFQEKFTEEFAYRHNGSGSHGMLLCGVFVVSCCAHLTKDSSFFPSASAIHAVTVSRWISTCSAEYAFCSW